MYLFLICTRPCWFSPTFESIINQFQYLLIHSPVLDYLQRSGGRQTRTLVRRRAALVHERNDKGCCTRQFNRSKLLLLCLPRICCRNATIFGAYSPFIVSLQDISVKDFKILHFNTTIPLQTPNTIFVCLDFEVFLCAQAKLKS